MVDEEKKGLIEVAPLAGAWIEMSYDFVIPGIWLVSLPSRERGLKLRPEKLGE